MVSQTATSIHDALQAKLAELGEALDGISEEKATRRPADGEWSCKELLSHLMGRDEVSVTYLKPFVEQDGPTIEVEVGEALYTPDREAMSFAEMRAAVEEQYGRAAEFLGSLSEEELARTGKLPPFFKETPLGDTVTLGQWANALINLHLADHVAQARAIRQALTA
jgi:hypothetical protein